jgi:hypothetical protein
MVLGDMDIHRSRPSQRHEYIIQMTLWSINSNIAEYYSCPSV